MLGKALAGQAWPGRAPKRQVVHKNSIETLWNLSLASRQPVLMRIQLNKKRNVRLARQGSKVVGLSHDFGLAGPDSKEVGSPLKLIGHQ